MSESSKMAPVFCGILYEASSGEVQGGKIHLCMVFIDLIWRLVCLSSKKYYDVRKDGKEYQGYKNESDRDYMYKGAMTKVKSVSGETEEFIVKVGVHPGT